MEILVYTSHFKCTLRRHPDLQVPLLMYITWASWFTSLIINVHYLDILFTSPIIKVHFLGFQVYKSYYKCTLPGHPGLQVS